MICFLLHIYYPDSLLVLIGKLQPMLCDGNYLLINFVLDTHAHMPELSRQRNIIAIRSTNKGKDIGGKLLLIDLYLRLGLKSNYMIFIHDKQSPQAATGNFWKEQLYKIIEIQNAATIESVFEKKKDVGLIGSRTVIRNEWNRKKNTFNTKNSSILLSLLDHYQFTIRDYAFVAGTMFWVRSSIYETFFTQYAPLKIRATLEEGNVLDNEQGTRTHAWERMLSWIATAQGYKLYGI